MVHRQLLQADQGDHRQWELPAEEPDRCHPVLDAFAQVGQFAGRGVEVDVQFQAGALRATLDGVELGGCRGVQRCRVADPGGGDDAAQGVGVAADVGGHVGARPPGQEGGRLPLGLVDGDGRAQQPLRGDRDAFEDRLDLALVHDREHEVTLTRPHDGAPNRRAKTVRDPT